MFEYGKATAIAVVMLVASFALLLGINVLQWWTNRHNSTQPRMTPAATTFHPPHAAARHDSRGPRPPARAPACSSPCALSCS